MTPEEFKAYIKTAADNCARWRAEQDPDWVEAHINLIDALRVMIRVDTRMGADLLHEDAITRAEFEGGMAEVMKMQEILDDIEAHEIDPTLYGVLKG